LKLIDIMKLQSPKRHRKGQGLVEYAFIIGFIALLLIAVIRLIPQPLGEIFVKVAEALGGTWP